MTRRRVVFLINSLAGGGAERVLCTLLRHSEAARADFDMTLVLLDQEPAQNEPPSWMAVRQLNCAGSTWRSVAAARAVLGELKPDLTLSFLTRANIANVLSGGAWRRLISARVNTSAHFGDPLRGALPRHGVRMLYPRADKIIAVSEDVAEDLCANFGARAARVVAIPNPIDIAFVRARAAEAPDVEIDEPFVLGVGRLVKLKNFNLLVRAFAESGWEGRLVIAGEGAERERLIETAHACGVADRLVLPGFVRNPYALMRRAALFVLPSGGEGFPNALVEAMCVGAPVVAANCRSGPSEILAESPRSSVAEAVVRAAHGVLAPPGAAGLLTEALRLMRDPAIRADYAAKGPARAGAFDAAGIAARYWTEIRAALEAGPEVSRGGARPLRPPRRSAI